MSEREICFKCKKPVGPYQPYPLENDGFANCKTVTCENCGNTMSIAEIIDSDLINSLNELADKIETKP